MTVALAIICDDGKSVVVASDRGMSPIVGPPGSQVQFTVDGNYDKISRVNSRTFVAYSGTVGDRDSIQKLVGDMSIMSAPELTQRLREAVDEHCRSCLDKQFRERGTSLQEVARSLVSQGALNVLGSIQYPSLKGDFLVAGVDAARARVFSVDDQTATEQDALGFEVIGNGATIAYSVLAAHGTNRGMPLAQAIYVAFEAKRITETVQGIGGGTQLGFITANNEATFLTASEISRLTALYDRHRKLSPDDEATISAFIQRRNKNAPTRTIPAIVEPSAGADDVQASVAIDGKSRRATNRRLSEPKAS